MTESGFAKTVNLLEGAFREKLTAPERDAYWLLWLDQADEAIFKAAVEYCRSDRARYGIPKPGDLLGRSSDRKALALLAWTLLLEKLDGWDSARFEDRRIHACVEGLRGWTHLADTVNGMSDFDFGVLKRDFETLYVSLSDEAVAAAPEVLTGHHEANNGERFAKFTPAPKQITCEYLSDAEVEKLESQMKALQAERGPRKIEK